MHTPLIALAMVGCGDDPVLNHAVALGFGGYVDTDVAFSEFFHENHTLTARFMPQHARGLSGPIFSTSGSGRFFAGVHTFDNGDKATRLQLQVGSARRRYDAPLTDGTWHTLEVQRSGQYVRLYLDGIPLEPALEIDPADPLLPDGTLRLGRTAAGVGAWMSDDAPDEHLNAQFYGLIDDVAVFGDAIDTAPLFADDHLTAGALDPSARAAYTFESVVPSGAAGAFARGYELRSPGYRWEGVGTVGPAHRVVISHDRNAEVDATVLPEPFQLNTYTLPFPDDTPWKVAEGNGSKNTHNAFANFSYDFVLASEVFDTGDEISPLTSCDRPLVTSASGWIHHVSDDNYDSLFKDAANMFAVQAGLESHGYLHLRTGSSTAHGHFHSWTRAGEVLGSVGTWGEDDCHLSFWVREEAVPKPIAFSDYEVSTDQGETWTHVSRGVPRKGQWVRRASTNHPPLVRITAPAPEPRAVGRVAVVPSGPPVWAGGFGTMLTAIANDPDEEGGTSCCTIRWYSDRDGYLGVGDQIAAVLSEGRHVLMARAEDPQGAVSTDAVIVQTENQPPVIEILSPTGAAPIEAGLPALFHAEVYDPDDFGADLCASTTWVFNGTSKPPAEGCQPVVTFDTPGPHTVTATVLDADGGWDSEIVDFNVVAPAPGGPPAAVIFEPADQSFFLHTAQVLMRATAADPDGQTPLEYAWRVEDAWGGVYPLGTGEELLWTPQDVLMRPEPCFEELVTVRLEVTDPDGLTGEDSIELFLGLCPPA